MNEGSDRPPPGERTGDATRQERLAQALRANLKRRKAQIRGRTAAGPQADASPQDDGT